MSPKPPQDFAPLTSLRFFAALMIFVFHLYSWNFAPSPRVKALAPGMFQGVSFFFVLSGFVLTHAYLGRDVSKRDFYRARIARIVPLHIACTLLLLALLPLPFACNLNLSASAALATFALKLTLLDAWVPTRAALMSWNSVSWSLSVEMAFYAVFPWLLVLMARRPLATLSAAAALSAAVFAAGLSLPLESVDSGQITLLDLYGYWPLARGFEFALGMAAYLFWRRYIAPVRLSPAIWTGIEAAALGFAALWLAVCVPVLIHGAEGALFAALRASCSAWMFAPLIALLAAGRGLIGRALSHPALVSLGRASFAFYLCHGLVLRALAYYGAPKSALLALVLSLALAFLLRDGVETPMRRSLLAPKLRPAGAAP